MSGSVQWISRCCLAAALVAGFGPAQAGPSVADSIDAIERASGAGDFANSLKLSADLLERTRDADAGRVAALQARIDAVVDAGEWAKQNGALRELVGRLPDASAREALTIVLDAGDAAGAANHALLLETAQKGLEKKLRTPPTFDAEMHSARARALTSLNKRDDAHVEASTALDAWHADRAVRARRYELALTLLLS